MASINDLKNLTIEDVDYAAKWLSWIQDNITLEKCIELFPQPEMNAEQDWDSPTPIRWNGIWTKLKEENYVPILAIRRLPSFRLCVINKFYEWYRKEGHPQSPARLDMSVQFLETLYIGGIDFYKLLVLFGDEKAKAMWDKLKNGANKEHLPYRLPYLTWWLQLESDDKVKVYNMVFIQLVKEFDNMEDSFDSDMIDTDIPSISEILKESDGNDETPHGFQCTDDDGERAFIPFIQQSEASKSKVKSIVKRSWSADPEILKVIQEYEQIHPELVERNKQYEEQKNNPSKVIIPIRPPNIPAKIAPKAQAQTKGLQSLFDILDSDEPETDGKEEETNNQKEKTPVVLPVHRIDTSKRQGGNSFVPSFATNSGISHATNRRDVFKKPITPSTKRVVVSKSTVSPIVNSFKPPPIQMTAFSFADDDEF